MKLLRIIHSLDPTTGGPPVGIRHFSVALSSYNVDTTVITLDPPSSPWLYHLPYHVIAAGPSISPYGFSWKLINLIRTQAQSHDLVVVDGIWQFHSLATYLALRGLDINYYVYVHGMLDPWFNQYYPLKRIKKHIYWNLAEYFVLKNARSVLFTTEHESVLAAQSYRRLKYNSKVVGFGVQKPPARSTVDVNAIFNRYPTLIGKRICLFLGRLHPKKGIDILMQAFSSLLALDPSVHLVIAGTGEASYSAYLQRLIYLHNLSKHATFTGHLEGELKWSAYYTAEIFALTSYQENFGIAVVEALGCGVPVLITSSINISPSISAAHAGFVTAPELKSVTSSLSEWIEMPPASLNLMGLNASKLFDDTFDINSAALKLKDYLFQ